MYDYVLRKTVEKIFFKLATKNPKQLERIYNKIEENQAGGIAYSDHPRSSPGFFHSVSQIHAPPNQAPQEFFAQGRPLWQQLPAGSHRSIDEIFVL